MKSRDVPSANPMVWLTWVTMTRRVCLCSPPCCGRVNLCACLNHAHGPAGPRNLFPHVDVAGCTSSGADSSCTSIMVGWLSTQKTYTKSTALPLWARQTCIFSMVWGAPASWWVGGEREQARRAHLDCALRWASDSSGPSLPLLGLGLLLQARMSKLYVPLVDRWCACLTCSCSLDHSIIWHDFVAPTPLRPRPLVMVLLRRWCRHSLTWWSQVSAL